MSKANTTNQGPDSRIEGQNMETKQKSIITIFGTDEEKQAMWRLRDKQADGSKLSISEFILQEFGIRKPAPDEASETN